ncbi:hypothetical protein BHS07_08850 [Myxococcus xanthus]|nr:hypothetical protein BHS07_08850 [Myxococcus xanthus]
MRCMRAAPSPPAKVGRMARQRQVSEAVAGGAEILCRSALVPVVEPEDFPQLYHLGSALRALHLTPLGRILAERQVRPARVAVALVLAKQAPSVGFVQDDDMVQRLQSIG